MRALKETEPETLASDFYIIKMHCQPRPLQKTRERKILCGVSAIPAEISGCLRKTATQMLFVLLFIHLWLSQLSVPHTQWLGVNNRNNVALIIWDRVLLYGPGWPQMHGNFPAPALHILGLQQCVTVHDVIGYIVYVCVLTIYIVILLVYVLFNASQQAFGSQITACGSHMGYGDQTQFSSLGGKHLYLPSHYACLVILIY